MCGSADGSWRMLIYSSPNYSKMCKAYLLGNMSDCVSNKDLKMIVSRDEYFLKVYNNYYRYFLYMR